MAAKKASSAKSTKKTSKKRTTKKKTTKKTSKVAGKPTKKKTSKKSSKKKVAGKVSRKKAVAAVDPTYDEIAARAYVVWERKGRPEGRDMENWREAEAELRAERGLA